MPITSDDLCAYAAQLLDREASETEIRAAVSRAYYAGFHALLPLVSQLPPSKKWRKSATHMTHEDFAERLAEWKTEGVHPALSRLASTAGQVLRATDANRGLRLKADYKLASKLGPAEAKMQVHRTRQILRATVQLNNAMAPKKTPV